MCALWYYDDDETDWASPADCGWGDVAHSDEGAVYLSELEWGRQIAEYKREASSDPDKYYSMGEANEIALLQYLGTRTYDQVLDATDDSHNHSDNPRIRCHGRPLRKQRYDELGLRARFHESVPNQSSRNRPHHMLASGI